MCRITELIELVKNHFFENKNILRLMVNRGPNEKDFFDKNNLQSDQIIKMSDIL
tara:strand:- start:277 stop:438 length:162 start_codon:yes stop_codon:yes gene_type:complete